MFEGSGGAVSGEGWSKAKLRVNVREAKDSDRDAVFEFCRQTWSWGDYIPHVWDKWLKEPNGKVFVATLDNDTPIGIQHITIDKPFEAWLNGARTAPKYRRMGVASALTMQCMEYAKNMGVRVVRLMTESNNVAALAAVQKMGFKPVAEFLEMELENPPMVDGNSHSCWADVSQLEAVWSYLQTSEVYRLTAGLYTVLYHWFSLDKPDLERFIASGKAIVYGGDWAIQGLILIDDAVAGEWRENAIQTCYIDGDSMAVSEMARFLLTHCREQGVEKVYGFTCNHLPIVETLERLGFKKPETRAIVFEKHL
jgi:ribosomal protein S18 acetylase RimI-like enzyme